MRSAHGNPRMAPAVILASFLVLELVLFGFLANDLGQHSSYGWGGPVFALLAALATIAVLVSAVLRARSNPRAARALTALGSLLALVALLALAATLYVFSANYL
jgi:uncharacterized membrane protein